MQQDITDYVTSCDVCQHTKSRNIKEGGLLQPIEIPSRPWEIITMDFIVQLPSTYRTHFDSIFVVVDKLTKMAHFLPMKANYTAIQVAKIFIDGIVCLHGVPKKVISDR